MKEPPLENWYSFILSSYSCPKAGVSLWLAGMGGNRQDSFSGSVAGVGVTGHLQAGGAISLAFYRPKSKETSAFPKSYPLRNRAFRAEMDPMKYPLSGNHRPETRRVMGGAARCSATIAAFALLLPLKVEADASFNGVGIFDITLQPAIPGVYAPGSISYSKTPADVNANGNVVSLGAPNVSMGAGGVTMSMSGATTYNASIDMTASADMTCNLANLTAAPINVTITYNGGYTLSATINSAPGKYDSADINWFISATAGSFDQDLVTIPVVATDTADNNTVGSFVVPLPASSITVLDVSVSMAGDALSVPEPTTAVLMLLSFGASTLQVLRKRRAAQQARQSPF